MSTPAPRTSAALSAPPQEWRRRAAARSNVYGLLALVFRDAPTSQVVAQLRAPPLVEALGHLGCHVAKNLAGHLETVTEHLREEYTRLLVGPGPHVSPYGSVHHEGEGRLWGDSSVRVKRFIEATGLSFDHNWDSIPDHVAIELEVMQRLTAREAELWAQDTEAAERGDENVDEQLDLCLQAEAAFLREHLCPWLPQFCDRVAERPDAPFYREMARLTKSFVLSDIEQAEAARRAPRPASSPGSAQRKEENPLP